MHLIDRLESRILFASLSIADGIVNYTGSSGGDSFTLSPTGDPRKFVLVAAPFAHPERSILKTVRGPIKSIRLDMRGGNDVVGIDAGRYAARVIADLGAGNDEMGVNSRGACVLTGGAGNDSLTGGSGDDLLDGGSGNDSFHGEDGKDTIIGGLGYDVLSGGGGDDLLLGKDGATDSFSGGPGQDVAKVDVGRTNGDYSGEPGSKRTFMLYADLESVS
jgi:Ca2+-binding RTX toxin-like protein